MKRIFIISILITICGITAMAQNRPDMTHQSTGRDRMGSKIYVDQPVLVYDNTSNQIAVYGSESEYYHVTITLVSTQDVVFTATINGDYDIIDASIMSSGTYNIALTSSHGNTYRWTFDHGLQSSFGVIDKIVDLENRFNGFDWTPYLF